MAAPEWTDIVSAIGTVLTPVAVATVGVVFARHQSRSEQLQRVRLEYYQEIMPDLNQLMCYMTFIGTGRDVSPPEVVSLKRQLDSRFNCALPLFGHRVGDAYSEVMSRSFATFGTWGKDALLLTSAYRRRQAWNRTGQPWDPSWDQLFKYGDEQEITSASLQEFRTCYDQLVAVMVEELSINRARTSYTTALVSMNASAPARDPIVGNVSK